MKMRLQSVRNSPALRQKLERDGWRVDQATDGSLVASHSGVVDEPDARQHLQQMGLLTSSRLRIEFLISLPAAAAHPTPRDDIALSAH